MVLVREDRVVRQAELLGPLDLGVPVGALHEAAHQPQLVPARHRRDVRNQFERACLVGLQRQAEAAPLRPFGGHARGQRLEHVERQLEPVDLFGIDGEVEAGIGRQFAQLPHARHQLAHHALALRVLVARMQRAELDGDAVVVLGPARRIGTGRNGADGLRVALEVAQRIGIGARAFAEHVVAEAQRALPAVRRAGLVHGLGDGLSEHELAPQQLHRAQSGGHHRAGAELGHEAGRMVAFGQEFLRHRDGGGRQPRQRGIGRALEIGPAQLVGRERDGRGGVGHAKQRLGQAHQRKALGAGDRVFAQQAFHGPERRRMAAHRLHPGRGGGSRGAPVERAFERGKPVRDDIGFRAVRDGQVHGSSLVLSPIVFGYRPNLLPKNTEPAG